MASIHRDPLGRSPFWIAAYTDATGRRLKKSTKTADREKALRMALQFERAARLARSGELTEHRSRELLSDLLAQISDGRDGIRTLSIRVWFVTWLEAKTGLLSAGSIWSYKAAVDGLLEALGPRADRPLTALTTADLQKWCAALRKPAEGKGLASKTVSIYSKVIRSSLKSACRQQLLTKNPADAFEVPKVVSGVREIFTGAEISLLLQSATTNWKTAIILGAFTGQRLRDVTDVKWSDVDLVAGTIIFRVKKRGGTQLVVPLHESARAHLEAIAGDSTGSIMPSLQGRSSGGTAGLSSEFGKLMKAAGIAAGDAGSQGRRKTAAKSFHSLRHGFVSGLTNAGIDESVRMRLAGHADAGSHRGYSHPELATLAAAVAKLPGISA